jgi:hypothetical protein
VHYSLVAFSMCLPVAASLGPDVDCTGTFKVDIAATNWTACCGVNILIYLNGSAYQIIPHNLAGAITVTSSGTQMSCQHNADSEDNRENEDTITFICGNNCGAAAAWTASYAEECLHRFG